MFARKAATRTSRRRPRTSSDDSVKPPKAKRQRSVLRQKDDTSSPDVIYDSGRGTVDQAASNIAKDNDVTTDLTGTDLHLPVRSVKSHDGSKNDLEGAILLSNTIYYSVEQLPALPDQIRSAQSDPLRCFFATGHAHALAVTSSHAIVWPYTVTSSVPSPSETFVVPIPETCRDPHGAIPLGVLLSTATGDYPGLLVIIPRTGKIIYWETVAGAASLALPRQKQYGIQGSTPGLLSGEHATEIVNCEPSGIIATFSSGRVAHITLRDSQGKPSVLVNFLRGMVGTGGGLLGGIKSVLGGSYWRKEVVAARAGASRQRGQRDVVVATSAGIVEIWDTHWNHGNSLKRKYDLKNEITAAIPQDPTVTGEHDFKVMDFAFASQQSSGELGFDDTDESWRLFLVITSPRLLHYKTLFVLDMFLSKAEAHVLSTHPVDLHCLSAIGDVKPRIVVSKTDDTAFIHTGSSLIIMSLPKALKETPTSQLLSDSQKAPLSFQDTINLRSGSGYEVLGYGSEESSDHETQAVCLMMIRNFGVVRVNVKSRISTETDVEEVQVTAKHKLEQAIFFGTMSKNPLNLVDGGGLDFPASEIEQASLEICKELLCSQSQFIPHTAISIEQSLRMRAKAIGDLATLLVQRGNPLSRPARWELLWGAERLAAQRAMWQLEETLRVNDNGSFLGHVIESMNDKFKTRLDPARGETDPVRQWFLRDSYRMEHIIPWIKNSIKPRRGNSSKHARKLSQQILEASDLFLSIMETAYRYRDEHASLYGLGGDFVEDGVLADGYEDLPEIWTSRAVGYAEAGHLLDWELDSCRAWIQQKASSADAPDGQVLKRIAVNSTRHLRVLGQMHRERTRWLASQGDTKLLDEKHTIEEAHVKERKWQLFKLAGIGHLHDALSLAEGFRDMGALVELVIELQDQVKGQTTQDAPSDITSLGESEADVNNRVSKYFEKFGEPWADAYFSRQISMGHPGALLSMQGYQQSVTRFLRKTPGLSKLSWINDVNGEEDYKTAALSLENLALGSEKQLWCHRVQVSLAKLGHLAFHEKMPSVDHGLSLQEDLKRLEGYSEIDEVQDNLRTYIQPVLEGAIDQKAEAELALGYFGAHIADDRPSLHGILGECLSTLVDRNVLGVDGLIDLLTLIGPIQPSEEGENELHGREFYQALRVLKHSRYAQQDPLYVSALQKLIWRRCMIKDDWVARGKAAESNGALHNTHADTALYQTLCSCLIEQPGTRLESLFQPLAPSVALMDDSESEVLVSRFLSEQRIRIAADLRRENEILREYVNNGRLDFWYQELRASIES